MSGIGGEQWWRGAGERTTAPYADSPQHTLVDVRPPPAGPPAVPPRRRGLWRVALGLAGVAAIGFGVAGIVSSRGHARAPAAAGPSKAVFIGRADAICARLDPVLDGEIETLIADAQDGDSAGMHAAGSQVATSTGELVGQISALRFTSAGAATVHLILNDYGELAGALLTDTGEGFAAAESLGEQIEVQATEFGFHVCGQS